MPEVTENPNWQEIVGDLNESMSLRAMGEACGLSLQAIHDLKSGRNAEPRYGAGKTLMRLHQREKNKQTRRANKEANV